MADLNPLDVTEMMRVASERGESKIELIKNAETQYLVYRDSIDGKLVKQQHLDEFRRNLDALKAEWNLPGVGPRPISNQEVPTAPEEPVPVPPDRPQPETVE